jgi:hypothetical protein
MADPAADGGGAFGELLPALRRLDRILERAVRATRATLGPAAADPFRGLHLSASDVERELAGDAGAPTLWTGPEPGAAAASCRLAWLADTFGLSAFDVDVVLIALACDIDLRYERIYAFLQDDVTRRRPTVALALDLLSGSADERLARRSHFGADAPLLQRRLLRLTSDAERATPPLLSHQLQLDEQIVRLLTDDWSLDRRLAECCVLTIAEPSPAAAVAMESSHALHELVARADEAGTALRLYFRGPDDLPKRATVEHLAAGAGMPLLALDLDRALESEGSFAELAGLACRDAWLRGGILYVVGLDQLLATPRAREHAALLAALADHPGVAVLAGNGAWVTPARTPLAVIEVAFPAPDIVGRLACWDRSLADAGVAIAGADREALAGRFRLTAAQIGDATASACGRAAWRAASEGRAPVDGRVTAADLFAAARAQSGRGLEAMATKVTPTYRWDDIVLPDDDVAQLREICARVGHRHRVMDDWGFAAKLPLGAGVTALFAGPSGTGKTMAAEIIAGELGLDLYRIDLAGIVSKYIGETEKNLERVFEAAEGDAVLLFDEADALFGKRSEVRDAHDRYANIEISYLLQRMERYDGITILATNLRGHVDEAFTRRLAFAVHFPFPDDASRRRIWAGVFPAGLPLAADADLDYLAREFKLSGGNIKNVALAAAYLAAGDGGAVTMDHLLHGVRREYQKMGKTLPAAELREAWSGRVRSDGP